MYGNQVTKFVTVWSLASQGKKKKEKKERQHRVHNSEVRLQGQNYGQRCIKKDSLVDVAEVTRT